MRAVFLSTAAFALMGMAPTGSAVVSVGGSSASSCYHAALARDASDHGMRECNTALNKDAIPYNDLVASYVNRGVLRLVRADYRNAEADFNQAMALQPNQAEAWLNKGIARYQQGDTNGALEHFDRAIKLHTRFPAIAHFGRALAHEDRGNIRGAYSDLRRASQLSPQWDAPRRELTRFQVRKPSA
jgi:tetratricopeptide (TPR) repeat protein